MACRLAWAEGVRSSSFSENGHTSAAPGGGPPTTRPDERPCETARWRVSSMSAARAHRLVHAMHDVCVSGNSLRKTSPNTLWCNGFR